MSESNELCFLQSVTDGRGVETLSCVCEVSKPSTFDGDKLCFANFLAALIPSILFIKNISTFWPYGFKFLSIDPGRKQLDRLYCLLITPFPQTVQHCIATDQELPQGSI